LNERRRHQLKRRASIISIIIPSRLTARRLQSRRASPSSIRALSQNRERGVSIWLVVLCAAVMFGMLGLAFDLGRMFITKNELQTFADASALGACRQLDGTKTGIQLAHTTATAGPLGSTKPNGWNFDTTTISNVTDTYATSFAGPYDSYATASAGATNTYRFIKVTATANMPVYFATVIAGLPTSESIPATATAGQQAQTAEFFNGGLAPVAPAAHNANDLNNFGLTPGGQYTLKWGNGSSTTCTGDQGFNPADSPSSHGFIDLGQGHGNSSLRSVITYGGYPNANSSPNHVSAGDTLYAVPGNRGSSIFGAFAERSNQDPDQTSITWEQYKAAATGNGRRIITTPVYDPAQSGGHGANAYIKVIGFANFLLDIGSSISGSSGPICATYIGKASMNGGGSGGTDGTKVYRVMLYQ
jgi:Flp pilus assembly protein TadG